MDHAQSKTESFCGKMREVQAMKKITQAVCPVCHFELDVKNRPAKELYLALENIVKAFYFESDSEQGHALGNAEELLRKFEILKGKP